MSDDYFSDEFDSAFLNEVDAIEASQVSSAKPTPAAQPPARVSMRAPPAPPARKASLSSDFDMSFDIDASELERLDTFIVDAYAGNAQPVAGPSKPTRQTTLDGSTLPRSPPKNQATRTLERTRSSSRGPLFGNRPQKTKQWDRTAFSETGWMSTKNKAKGKEKGKGKEPVAADDFEEDYDEEIEFEQFPSPCVSGGPPPPMRLKPDLLAAKDWIFPLNRPRRDYQFNIAKACLFENTLVALPTGLGKTFIAGVVMLNYYRWFPKGKIVFVAPTKPLVSQQINACHEVCGIPGRDAAELTGNVPKYKRTAAWAAKRVVYMTPQTLRNDLSGGLVDPLDIVLLVIDEAHKGTGDYAYAQVVRYMMAKNPHFRVLALTATPGNTTESVQSIVDSLHISHIEIRNEQSHDLQKYIFKKEIKIHIIKMDESVSKIRDLLSSLIEPHLKRVVGARLMYASSPVMLHPYACQSTMQKIGQMNGGKGLSWAFGVLKVLRIMAQAMGNLMECSLRMCFQTLKGLRDTLNESDKPTDKQMRVVLKHPDYLKLMEECERQETSGFAPHPKMDKLLSLLLSHFVNTERNPETLGTESSNGGGRSVLSNDSKIMVFVQFRDCVEEVMQLLNRHRPMLRAAAFIGQAKDKQGRSGLGQAGQLGVIRKFKEGEFNILVSTSIGEEGLDIGEIDRIICYDSQKSSIRMLQRVGRTGRKRAGFVDVLLAEEREERNWEKSKESYTDVQDTIISGNQLELYGDVERLLPDRVQPQCIQTTMEIEEYVSKPAKDSPAKDKKRKRNNDINRNVPLGAMTGFVTAAELRPKTKKAKKAKLLRESDLDEDSDDAEIVSGLRGPTSTPKKKKPKATSKTKGKKANVEKSKTEQRSMKDYFKDPLPDRLEDDEDDVDIQLGLKPLKGSTTRNGMTSSDSSDSEVSPVQPRTQRRQKYVSSPPDSVLDIAARKRTSSTVTSNLSSANATLASPGCSEKPSDWLLTIESDSDVEVLPELPSSRVEVDKPRSINKGGHFRSAKAQLRQIHSSSPDPSTGASTLESSTAKPVIDDLASPLRDNTNDSFAVPEPTFEVRRPVKRRAVKLRAPPSSPTVEQQPAPRRIVRRQSPDLMPPPAAPTLPQMPKEKVTKRPKLKMKSNPMLFDVEAAHSGDEMSEGDSDVDMVESDSDRRFLEEPVETQVSPSYNQTAAYRMGLMTQAPGFVSGLHFAQRPKRVGAFAGGRTQVPHPEDWSSSPARGSEPDEYHMGSFVVNDDDTILCDQSSES